MHRTTRLLRAATATLVLGGTLALGAIASAPRADAAPAPTPIVDSTAERVEHCVLQVVDQADDGELITAEPVCAATRPAALERAGVVAGPRAATWVIGGHFDGFGYTGASFSVVGSDCNGGWLNAPAGWNNRISSTLHGCPLISHFDGYYLVVPQQQTLAPGGNLGLLNNRTSSLQYLH